MPWKVAPPVASASAVPGFRAEPAADSQRIARTARAATQQLSFDELGEPLRDVTFVVVDLETTGGSAAVDSITEFGAVKVRGGEVIAEFQTLVDPGTGIPPYIQILTGITNSMMVGAPRIDSVLPAFLEFAGLDSGTVIVAHNAPFDVGFLKAASERLQIPWPTHRTVDTAITARRVLTRDEVPNCKLSTLAAYFRAEVTPNHRALSDARATVDVLHALFERLGPLGVHSLPELIAFSKDVTPAQRRKRHLATDLPNSPGVYIFRDLRGEPLYVGKSKDLRRRVRDYFTASEPRARIKEMVGLAEKVDAVVCAHELEAHVREVRLIAALRPRYNRRSKFPERAVWVKLTDEAFPRLSIVRKLRDDGCDYLGPFGSARSAEGAIAAIHDSVPVRRCTQRISPKVHSSACALAELGRCGAPCEGQQTVEVYAGVIAPIRQAIHGDVGLIVRPLLARIEQLSVAQRYEEAGSVRDRAMSLVRACVRAQRLELLMAVERLVAAAPDGAGGWHLTVVRRGRLVGAAHAARGVAVRPLIAALQSTEETLLDDESISGLIATHEETEIIGAWLERPGTRLVELEGQFACAVPSAAKWHTWLNRIDVGRKALNPFASRQSERTLSRPARAHVG